MNNKLMLVYNKTNEFYTTLTERVGDFTPSQKVRTILDNYITGWYNLDEAVEKATETLKETKEGE